MTDPRVTVEPDVLDRLVRHACFAADLVAMERHATGAARTRAVVRRGLEMLLANGLVEVVPAERWPEYVSLHPLEHGPPVTGDTGG